MGRSKGISPARQQDGVVAIFAVLIIMGILTLLAVAFSGLSRQSLRRTLDDQLNTQAFYAAESGVNMVWDLLKSGSLPDSNKESCDSDGLFPYDIDGTNNVAISCLLYSRNVPNLEFSHVPADGDPVVSFVNGSLGMVDIEWDASEEGVGLHNGGFEDGSPSLPPANSWGSGGRGVGMIRVDLVPEDSIGDRANSVSNSYTVFLYPSGSTGTASNPATGTPSLSVAPGPNGGQGATLLTRCATTGEYRCFGRIILTGSARTNYYARVRSYYTDSKLVLTARNASGNAIPQTAQVLVDVTGRANDVYRRIQVRLPFDLHASYNTGQHTPYSLISGETICKRYIGAPGNIRIDGPTTDPSCDLPAGIGGGSGGDSLYTNPCAFNACSPGGNNENHPCRTGADNGECYTQFFRNGSSNPPEIVSGCVWNWGDGTPEVRDQACLAGQEIRHRFPDNLEPRCTRVYTITLTIFFNNGAQEAVYSNTRSAPWGGPDRRPCP